MNDPSPPPPTSPTPSGVPDRRALLEAYKDVVREDSNRRTSQPAAVGAPSRGGLKLLGLVVLVALLIVVVRQPAWLFSKPPTESPALQDASLRVRMYVEIDRVDRFRGEHGRLPATLAEAGGDSTGLEYQVEGEGFTLTGRNGGLALSYSSTTPAQEFLGDSYKLIRDRRRP